MVNIVSVVFHCLTFVTVAVALVLNGLGIYLLAKLRARISNQNVILINISLIKMILSITEAVLCVLEIVGSGTSRIYQVFDITNAGLYGVNHLTVVILTLDRLLATIIPLRYNRQMTKVKLRIPIIASWIIGTAGIVPFFVYDYSLLYSIYYKIVFLTLDGIVLLVAVITYGSILKTLLRKERTFDRGLTLTKRSVTVSQRFGRFFYVSSLIIASFILCVAIPDVIYASLVIIQGNEDPMIEHALGLVWSIYLVSDPLIYIFLQKPIRLKFCSIFSRAKVGTLDGTSRFDPVERMATNF